MKILIAADMEGITGVTTWDHVTPGHAEYARFRKLMTQDINAAARGALDAGTDEIVVADGHWNGANILVEELDARVRLNGGSPSPLSMMEGIGADVAGVFFVGYHARHGSQNAILDHTWSSTCVANVWLNDEIAGEYTLNAAVAGHFGVPIVMASGDQTACAQMAEQLGDLEMAVVKQATGRYAAECLSPDVTQKLLYDAAQRAIVRLKKNEFPGPFTPSNPIKITVQFFTSDMADRAMHMLGAQRDGLKVSFETGDMLKAYSGFRSLVNLAYPR